MAFYNITNPQYSKNWVGYPADSLVAKNSEVVKKEEYRSLWSKLNTLGKTLDAGKIQKVLEDNGFLICHDEKCHSPNGVSTSSAGVLIVFDEEITPEKQSKIDSLISGIEKDLDSSPDKYVIVQSAEVIPEVKPK